MNGFADLSPVIQALIATLCTCALTAVGATVVVFTRKVSRTFLDASLGFELVFTQLVHEHRHLDQNDGTLPHSDRIDSLAETSSVS